MQLAEKETKSFYKSGLPKHKHEGQRNKYNLKINERLKVARNRKGLSTSGVVKSLKKKGVSIGQSTLQGYEADEKSLNHRYPSLPVLIELSSFYGCSLDYLFGITDKFKITPLTSRSCDIRDILESGRAIEYNGVKLNKKQREIILAQLDSVVAETI
jgi:transcriptional regulator with XRE-family HTH domain